MRFTAKRVVLLEIACGIGLAACGPRTEAPATPAAAGPSSQAPDGESPEARARRLLAEVGLGDRTFITRDETMRAAAVIPASTAAELLESILAPCLEAAEACEPAGDRTACADESLRTVVEPLLAVLGETGTADAAGLLWRADRRGLYAAQRALDRILERVWQSERNLEACAPPDEAALAVARTDLDDFRVLRLPEGRLEAEPLTAGEKEDFAYFLAAVAESGPEVGTVEAPASPFRRGEATPDPERERLRRELEDASCAGDLEAVHRLGLSYLRGLGYPEPLRTGEEDEWAWGGARFSFVMRDTARAAEIRGDLETAAELYRRADPGGGMCGTSVSSRWQQQVKGLIRAEERRGRCGAVVAERLLGLGELAFDQPDDVRAAGYGPEVLQRRGYDVARLYRGALAARNRELPEAEASAALARIPGAAGEAVRARWAARGAEAWERRVRALEGWADLLQADAWLFLEELLGTGTPDTKARVLDAMGELGRRPLYDPCGDSNGGEGWGSSEWSRPIRWLGRDCATRLDPESSAELARTIEPSLRDDDVGVRRAALEALAKVASPASIAALERIVAEAAACGGDVPEGEDEDPACDDAALLADEAQRGLERIDEVEASGGWTPSGPDAP